MCYLLSALACVVRGCTNYLAQYMAGKVGAVAAAAAAAVAAVH